MKRTQTEELEFESTKKGSYFGIGFIFREEGIIRLIVAAKPWIHRDVKVSNDVKAKVIEWLRNPRKCDKQEWDKIREPLLQITLVDLVLEHGDSHMRTVLEKLSEKNECAENDEQRPNHERKKNYEDKTHCARAKEKLKLRPVLFPE